MALTEDRFLSEVLGRPAFRYAWVTTPSAGDLVGLKPGSFAFARLPTAAVSELESLVDLGFRVVDVTMSLEVAASVPPRCPNSVRVRPAGPSDRNSVARIAATAFQFSRFHLDPRLPKALADATRVAWADNFFGGTYGDLLVVAESESGVDAFLLGLRPGPDLLVISLIATAQGAQGRGLGRALIGSVAALPGVRRLRVGTQAANTRALRFYETLGFRTMSTEYTCHLHT